LQKTRPTGVTVLAVLEILSGLMLLLAGLGFVALGTLATMPTLALPEFLVAIAGILGAVFIILGIVSFALAYGLWTGRGWAWTLSLVFAVLGTLLGLLSVLGSPVSGIVQILVCAIIVYYLYRPYVKSYFGKGGA
jgi:hypothetical protein